MKVLTWNVNKAGESRRELWKMLKREDADIVLLQEVTGIPEWIRNRYQCHSISPWYFGGHNAPFSSAVLSKGSIDATLYLKSELEWVNRIHTERYGWIVGCEITLNSGERFRVVAVHSPAFAIPRDQWADADVSSIKLTNNPELWFTEILWALLRTASIADGTNWIVSGDFNSSVKFDKPKDRGNQEIIDRLNRLGLTDCLSHLHYGAVPTFQHTRKVVEQQLDYCYVNGPMLERLTQARVPSHEVNYNPGCSEIIDAHEIGLRVLAPTQFYEYKSHAGARATFDLGWLETMMRDATRQLASMIGGETVMDFRLDVFPERFSWPQPRAHRW